MALAFYLPYKNAHDLLSLHSRVARGSCTPRRSQIPDLNVSAHPALIAQSPLDATMANEQIAVGLLKLSC